MLGRTPLGSDAANLFIRINLREMTPSLAVDTLAGSQRTRG